MSPTILWFRLDLRLEDNPALDAALRRGAPIIPVYLHTPDEEGAWRIGGASQYWLHQSLKSLNANLEKRGTALVIRKGPRALALLDTLISETGAAAVYWNRRYEPTLIARDAAIKSELKSRDVAVESFNSALLFEPWEIQNKQGLPFQVFTPFWKNCLTLASPPEPRPAPKRIDSPSPLPRSESLSSLKLEPAIDWAKGIRATWVPGEDGAHAQLGRFLKSVAQYPEARDRPDQLGTSRLSPHLHFGEIGPRQIWHATREHGSLASIPGTTRGEEKFLSEVGWREFAHHLLYHFPTTIESPLRAQFEQFPWAKDRKLLRAWQKGKTGYPIVDAGMRELWQTGWMHNRVRMIVASFLTKDLLIPWQDGARWFWDTLVDADLASNTLGWQWTAGCGADAAPYFRIFNPTSQGIKFDPQGDYVRRYVPELAALDAKWIHNPSEAPAEILRAANIVLGETYPTPVVDHGEARARALEAFASIKGR